MRAYLFPLVIFILVGCQSSAVNIETCAFHVDFPNGCFYSANSRSDGRCAFHVIKFPSTIQIEAICNQGVPPYSSGGLSPQSLKIQDGIAVIASKEFDCKIVFYFQEDSLKVWQFGRPFDCGQGSGVTLDGTYFIRPEITPMPIGCMRTDDPCNLAITPTP